MKIKPVLFYTLSLIVMSCASKQVAPPPVIAPSPEELKTVRVAAPAEPKPAEIAGPSGPVTESALIAEGKTLYENNCAKCHRLFAPKEFTNDQWKPLVHGMQKNTPLNDYEISKVLAYVTSESK